jgi:hypothetical protein
MILQATGGTDGANLVLFWPALLPGNADDRLQSDPVELMEELSNHGKLVWFPCDGDGTETLSVYVRTPIPADLLALYEIAGEPKNLQIRGPGYFSGAEYIHKRDSAFFDKYPGMWTQVDIPDGRYRATIFVSHIPVEFEWNWLRSHVAPQTFRLWLWQQWVYRLAVLGFFATLGTIIFASQDVWLPMLGGWIVLLVATVLCWRSRANREIVETLLQCRTSSPTYLLELAPLE